MSFIIGTLIGSAVTIVALDPNVQGWVGERWQDLKDLLNLR